MFLNRLVKMPAIGGCVIKSMHALMLKVAEIIKARVAAHLVAQCDQLAVNVMHLCAILLTTLRHRAPTCFALGAVGIFQVARHLRQSFFFAIKVHHHGAGDFAVGLIQFGGLGLQSHIFRAEQFHFLTNGAKQHAVAIGVQLWHMRAVGNFLV